MESEGNHNLFLQLFHETEAYSMSPQSKKIILKLASAYVEPEISYEKRAELKICINKVLQAYRQGLNENDKEWLPLMYVVEHNTLGVIIHSY
ncbi:hypothetical protein BGZ58_010365 [Dissophora ornata]|nr:hypothetical protein BGZ58_010365 [Dissophora ornata]